MSLVGSSVRVGSLCSGYGGLDLGFELAIGPVEHAWHVEYDKAPSAILAHRFPGVPNYGDLTTLDYAAMPRVDWLTAGYPCQPFSHAGKRKGTDDERHLWPYVAAAIGALRPRGVLLVGHGDDVRAGSRADERRTTSGGGTASDARSGPLTGSAAAGDGLRVAAECGVVAAAHTESDGRDQGRAESARLVGGPDAAECGDDLCAECGCVEGDHDEGGFCAGPCGGECTNGGRRLPNSAYRLAADTNDADWRGRHPQWRSLGRDAAPRSGESGVEWGAYEPAIRRWERVTGRDAPRPTEPGRSGERLSPRFVEWMMGLPAGWVTDVPGLARNAQLKALGNGVVPQQAALALRLLLPSERQVAA